MEEVCHVFLGHKPSRLAIENRNKDGKVIARDYNHSIEEEAYSTGAAALVALYRFEANGGRRQNGSRDSTAFLCQPGSGRV